MTTDSDMPASTDDKLQRLVQEPIDELDCELDRMADAIIAESLDGEIELCSRRFRRTTVDEGRLMAIFSHCSVLFGIPVFVVPMIQRDNEFALHHARAAAVIFIACLAMLVAAVTNCAVFLPLVFVCYVPALIGIYRAAAGVEAGTAALGRAGEKLLGRIEVDK